MTAKKGESALGRGLDALIRKEKPKNEDKPKKEESSEKIAPVKKKTPEKTVARSSSKVKSPQKTKKQPKKAKEDPNRVIIDGVVMDVRKNPRISLWSARSAAVLRFLKNTKPAFSISKEASALIEEAVQQKYPEIWEMFDNEDF